MFKKNTSPLRKFYEIIKFKKLLFFFSRNDYILMRAAKTISAMQNNVIKNTRGAKDYGYQEMREM